MSPGVVIPAGTYRYTWLKSELWTPSGSSYSGSLALQVGEFYDGNFASIGIGSTLRPASSLDLSGSVELTRARFPDGRADLEQANSKISVIDLNSKEVIRHIPLANGSNALRGMSLSADGNFLFITHNLGRFQVPTTQLEQGWMNTSALSVIDARMLQVNATVLLDEPDRGAPGSWGVDSGGKGG